VDGWSTEQLTLLGGGGYDLFFINAASADMTVDGQEGSDQYTLLFGALNGVVTLADSGASGVDTLTGDGTPEDDTFTISNTQTTCGAERVVYGETVEAIEMSASQGDDTFDVRASSYFTLTVDGFDQPNADVLNFDAQGQPVTWDWPNGVISVPGLRSVYYFDIEQVNFINRWLFKVWMALVGSGP
jgi:hypothetical protein